MTRCFVCYESDEIKILGENRLRNKFVASELFIRRRTSETEKDLPK